MVSPSLSHLWITYDEHLNLHHLDYTGLKCIRSCIENLSHSFFTSWWVVHSQFINLGNPSKTIVHYLLSGGMTYIGNQDRVSIVNSLVCMVKHWIRLICAQLVYVLLIDVQSTGVPWFRSSDGSNQQNL